MKILSYKLIVITACLCSLLSACSQLPDNSIITSISVYPNPFTATGQNKTSIYYTLTKDADIELSIIDSADKLVLKKEIPAGQVGAKITENKIDWNGLNQYQELSPNDDYTIILKASNTTTSASIKSTYISIN